MFAATPTAFFNFETCAWSLDARVVSAQALVKLRVEPEDIEASDGACIASMGADK